MGDEAHTARIRELEAEIESLRKRMQQQGALASRFRTLANSLPAMISFIDRDERYLYANEAYEEWFGIPVDQIVGRRVSDIMSPEAYLERASHIRRALAGERIAFEASFPHRDGDRRTIIHQIPLVEDGEVVGINAMVQDITDQWRARRSVEESERRFRRIADSAPIPMWVTGADRLREFVNVAYVDFLGVPYEEALTFDWRTILHADDADRILAESLAGEASGEPFEMTARYRRSDGEWRWLLTISQPRFDTAGMPEGFIGVAKDITASKNAEVIAQGRAETLSARVDRRTRERDRLWSLSQDPIVICDRHGALTSVNPAMTRLLGWPEDMLVGRTTEWLNHPDDRAAANAARHRLAAGDELRDVTSRLRASDGSYRWISWNSTPDGATIYCVGRDVTRQREQDEALRHAEDSLRQSQKIEALGQLTGGVAHDFNNLLTPILATLDLVSRHSEPAGRTARLVQGAIQSAERARVLVQRLLAFARRQPLRTEAVSLRDLVLGMTDLLRTSVGSNVTMKLDLPEDLPPALADANQVEMALLNLAVNARDAMPSGGVLAIAVERYANDGDPLSEGDYVALRVTDDGSGMDEDTLRRAVEPFFSTKAPGAGTGLGLSMVHGLAAQLGGRLVIDSAPDRGTTIVLVLPATEYVAQAAARPASLTRESMRILLVDDDALVRASTAAMLTELRHDVTDCKSAEEAMQLMERGFIPDVLVTDQVMPGMSGTQLVDLVRRRWPEQKALLVSGFPQGEGMNTRSLHRLAKPFRTTELADALASL